METDNTGHRLTVADLFEEYKQGLHRYATSLTQDTDRADDLVQEAFIQAMANLELLNRLNKHQQQAWLYRVLKNRFIDQQRKHQRFNQMLEQLSQSVSTNVYPVVNETFYGIFDLIPDRYRDLIEKRYVFGMNSTEIGQVLGLPPATIRSRLRLAISWLRKNQSKFI